MTEGYTDVAGDPYLIGDRINVEGHWFVITELVLQKDEHPLAVLVSKVELDEHDKKQESVDKAIVALRKVGLDLDDAVTLIDVIQNAGILFRERT